MGVIALQVCTNSAMGAPAAPSCVPVLASLAGPKLWCDSCCGTCRTQTNLTSLVEALPPGPPVARELIEPGCWCVRPARGHAPPPF